MNKTIFFLLMFWSVASPAFVFYEDTKIWNQDSITLYFLDGTVQQKSEVKRFAKLWQRYTGIKFIYVEKKPSLFSFKPYYKITFKGNSNQSTKGAINGTIQLGNLSDNIIFRKMTILHEFGHMLGLGHEHQRTNRPSVFNNSKLIMACIKSQRQSKSWCEENLSNTNKTAVFIESDYDILSIMHYDLKNMAGNNKSILNTLPKSKSNTLSYTDKYYIAMLYNQNISDKTLEQMHKQDVWNQQKFERAENHKTRQTILSLRTSSCKILENGKHAKNGKFCKTGFMIIGTDDFGFPDDEFNTCYNSITRIKEQMDNNKHCQLSKIELHKKRHNWKQQFSQYGQCKRLEPNSKNRQEFFCEEGYSFVTKNNDMVGGKTMCYSSVDSAFKAMQENIVCNMDNFEFRKYQRKLEKSENKKMKTKYCQVVKKKYKYINCPKGFDFTIIDSGIPMKPINDKCFSSKFQASNAMSKIPFCQN